MSLVSGIRLGLCFLRYGPQQGLHVLSFCRHQHSVADLKSNHSGKPPSCSMSTAAPQQKIKTFRVDLSEISEEIQIAQSCKSRQVFITDDNLANNILESLGSCNYRTPPMLEYNPGPGILTRGLLDAGFRVAALEKEAGFIPGLKKLEADSEGQLRAFYCNPYNLDNFYERPRPPPMYVKDLMEELGINAVPWDAESPFNIFGILHPANECLSLGHIFHKIYDKENIFTYGRAELNLFVSENVYKSLSCGPTDTINYKARTVISNIAFDCQLLLKCPVNTVLKGKKLAKVNSKSKASANTHMYLLRLTPRRDLFNDIFLPGNSKLFMTFIRLCFIKRKKTLGEQLMSWNPGDENWVLQHIDVPEDKIIREMLPHEFKKLFEVLLQSQIYSHSFLLDYLQKTLG